MRRLLGLFRSAARSRAGRADRPRMLTYVVSFTCNARCEMCDSWKKPSEGDLEIREIERVFRQLPRLDFVRLTGGEPFVRRDMVAIADLAQEHLRPAVLHVTTNGFLTDRIVEFCERRRKRAPLRILVSLDGVGEKHDRVRGRERSWERAYRTVEVLARRRRDLSLSVGVNQTILDEEGLEHYPDLRSVLRRIDVPLYPVLAYEASAMYSVENETVCAPEAGGFPAFGRFDRDRLADFLDRAERDAKHLPFAERTAKRYYLRGMRNRLLRERNSPRPRCVALSSHLRILPNGDVPTCQFNTTRVGNLRERTFDEIWSAGKTETQRDWVRGCPGCWAECEVLPNALYSGDLVLPRRTPPRSGVTAGPSGSPPRSTRG